jgi:hypothetical protein
MTDFQTVYEALKADLLGWGAAAISVALIAYAARWVISLLNPPIGE